MIGEWKRHLDTEVYFINGIEIGFRSRAFPSNFFLMNIVEYTLHLNAYLKYDFKEEIEKYGEKFMKLKAFI